MTDNDHNAFVSMYKELDCENPFDQEFARVWEDWEDEDDNDWWL